MSFSVEIAHCNAVLLARDRPYLWMNGKIGGRRTVTIIVGTHSPTALALHMLLTHLNHRRAMAQCPYQGMETGSRAHFRRYYAPVERRLSFRLRRDTESLMIHVFPIGGSFGFPVPSDMVHAMIV